MRLDRPEDRQIRHFAYRPDVDGLRALAVLAVVGFHAFPGYVRGGFFGVDVFFVISGYLISGLILNGVHQGTFTFADFYSRRVRRIFPAVALVALAYLVAGWLLLLPFEFEALGKHLAGALAFVSNFVLLRDSGYFDVAMEVKPLAHMWSLGVEEQFYILWPLILVVALKRSVNLLSVLLTLFILSFVMSIWLSESHQDYAFYLPTTRFWELMLGCGLACLEASNRGKAAGLPAGEAPYGLNAGTLNTLALIGLGMVLASVFLLDSERPVPGWWSLVPTLGIVLLLVAGSQTFIARNFLSVKPIVLVGLISYPLYLWHWPMLSFARIVEPKASWQLRIGLIGLSGVLAWITYRYVEVPVRFGKRRTQGVKTIGVLCFVVLALGVVSFVTYLQNGFPGRMDIEDREATLSHRVTSEFVANTQADLSADLESPTRAVAFFGDSHAQRLFSGLQLLGRRNVGYFGKGGCLPLVHVDTWWRSGLRRMDNECQPSIDEDIERLVSSKSIEVVVIAAFYPQYLDGRISIRSPGLDNYSPLEIVSTRFRETVAVLVKSNKRIVLVLGIPEFPDSCLPRRPYFFRDQSSCVMPIEDEQRRSRSYRQVLSELTRIEGVTLFDPRDVLCDRSSCFAKLNDHYIYMPDGNHLSDWGSRLVAERLSQAISSTLSAN